MAMGVTPTAAATRRIVTASAPSRSSSRRAAAAILDAVERAVTYTAYTILVYGVYSENHYLKGGYLRCVTHESETDPPHKFWRLGYRIPAGCYTFDPMYARKLQVAVLIDGERRPCPLEWLDSFCMRNFTGSAEFDDTLPLGDGKLEASLRVDPAQFAASFAEWINQRGKAAGKKVQVEIHEEYVPPRNP